MKTQHAAIDRFLDRIRIDPVTECWNWLGVLDKDDYGLFKVDGKQVRAHRFAYEYFRGPIPDEHVLDHLCRNHPCSNPYHGEPVTSLENTRRGQGPSAANVRKTHCIRGHAFTPDNTMFANDGMKRVCRACGRVRSLAAYHRAVQHGRNPNKEAYERNQEYHRARAKTRWEQRKKLKIENSTQREVLTNVV